MRLPQERFFPLETEPYANRTHKECRSENKDGAFMNGDMRIQSLNIFLRPIEITDANGPYLSWLNDPEINQYLESRFAH